MTYNPCPTCGEATWPYDGDVWTCKQAHRHPVFYAQPQEPADEAAPEQTRRLLPLVPYLGGLCGFVSLVLHIT